MTGGERVKSLPFEAQSRTAELSERPSGIVTRGIAPAIDDACAWGPPGHAFLRCAWFEAGAAIGCMTIVGLRPNGSVLAAIPLTPMGPRMLGMWMVPGSYWPFRSAVIAEDAGVEELSHFLREDSVARALGQAWRMGPAYADDFGARRLASAAEAAGWTILERKSGTTWLIDVPALRDRGAWPPRSLARKVRSHERQLEALGPVSHRFVSGSAWDGAALDALAAIEAQSWVGKSTDGSGAKFLRPEQRAYWESALKDPALAGMLSAAILFVGETPAAFSFDLTVGRLQYGIASSYDERFARCGPGKVVGLRQLLASEARGVEVFDWGCGDSGYKSAIGAVAGSDIVDYLFVRSRPVAALLGQKWTAGEGAAGDDAGRFLSRRDQLVLAALVTAAAAAAIAE